MRIEKSGIRYFGLNELAKAYNVKRYEMPEEKRNSLEKSFKAKHICKACKTPMVLSTGNILVCSNNECKGIKHTRENIDGTISVWYEPSFELLDEIGENIAERIF